MKKYLNRIPSSLVLPIFILGGVIVGLGIYALYVGRATSYLSDNPSACVNCHIMTPYYDSWKHSSHANAATCNDCHVPQDNALRGYAFKATDGLYHAAVFTLGKEPTAIRPRDASYGVIQENCIRCHTELNTNIVNTGHVSYQDVKEGKGKACWDCHQHTPHGKESTIHGTPGSYSVLPGSPVPEWLKTKMKEEKEQKQENN